MQKKVESFQKVTGYNGDIHRPNYLKVAWGRIQIKRCVLKSASIVYKLFKPSGVPLRAVASTVELNVSRWDRKIPPFSLSIPGDLSSAAFLMVAHDNSAAIALCCLGVRVSPRLYPMAAVSR